VPQAVDLVVDGGVLLDVRVGRGNVSFRLVVVVVADEELDRVLREQLLELAEELPRQGLVVRDTRVGFCTCATTLAMVNVLPEPVTPSRAWCRSPRLTPATSSPIARGWSPCGLKSLRSLKGMAGPV